MRSKSFGKDDERSTPAHIAQLAEHALGKGEVIGSNPIVGSTDGNGPNDRTSKQAKRLAGGPAE